MVRYVEYDGENFALTEGVDECVKIFSKHSIFVVDCERIYAVQKDKIALRLGGSQNVQCSQEYRFEHNWAIDEVDVWIGYICTSENARGDQIDELDV